MDALKADEASPSRKPDIDAVEREFVTSSHLLSLGYSETRRVLAVEFKDGVIFHYRDVEPRVWEEIERAESKGSAFHHLIKGQYKGAKMTGECPKCGDKPGIVGEPCSDCGTDVYECDCGAQAVLVSPPTYCNLPRRHEQFVHAHINPRWTTGPLTWLVSPQEKGSE